MNCNSNGCMEYAFKNITRLGSLIILFITGLALFTNAEVTYKCKPNLGNQWVAESLFVGADIMTLHSSAPVKIKMKDIDRPTAATCALYLMNPVADTAIFIATNKNTSTNEISIGTFPDSTQLVFMVKVIDTSIVFQRYYDKKIYSGQNRAGVDKFISDRSLPDACHSGYGARWAVVGRLDSTKIEVGFEERENLMFRGVVFEVLNATIKK